MSCDSSTTRAIEPPTIERNGAPAAVIARKVSQCSKTQRGADAFAAFTTVIRTIAKRATLRLLKDSFLAAFRRLLPSQ